MKKIYVQPSTNVLAIKLESMMTTQSSMSVGNEWKSGDAASRSDKWSDED